MKTSKNSHSLPYKKTLGILTFALVVLSIPITVLLVGQQQDLRQRAEYPAGPRYYYPLKVTSVTCAFGYSSNYIYNADRTHYGTDLKANENTEVRAVANGKIIYTSSGFKDYYRDAKYYSQPYNMGTGNTIVEELTDGSGTRIVYAHLKSFVKTSGSVNAGEKIAYSGNTGTTSGAHLHLGILLKQSWTDSKGVKHYYKWTNPVLWLSARGVKSIQGGYVTTARDC